MRGFLATLDIHVDAGSADLVASGQLDSLVLVELLFFIEQHFSVRVDVEQLNLDDFRTIERICAFVARTRGR